MSISKPLNYVKVLWSELLSSPAIYLASLLFLCVCAFGDSAVLGDKCYSVIELLFDRELYRKACDSADISAYSLLLNYDSSRWFTVAVSVITAFPVLRIYELNTNNLRIATLSRIRRRNYINSLFSTVYFSGVFIALTGILLYSGMLFMLFPKLELTDGSYFLEVYGSTHWERFLYISKKAANCCFVCGVFPLLTVIFSQLIHDRFLSITFPMMMQYIFLKLDIIYSGWLYADEARSSSFLLKFIQVINPASCMYQYSYWKFLLGLPFACFGIMLLFETALLYILFSKLQKLIIGEKI